MSGTTCGREPELLAAIAAGELPDELRQHAAECAACAETLIVATFLRREAAAVPARPLPDPAYLWWRASLEQRSAVAERATRLITIIQRASIVAAVLLMVPLTRWGWPHVRQWLGALDVRALAPALPAEAGNPALVIAISATLLAVLALLDLRADWNRD
jgi:hypothetical protein